MTPANPLSTVGLMLTLSSLLGSFFYIQLSQWLRDLLALRQKTDLNKYQGDEAQKRAIVECRIELTKLSSWQTYAVNIAVIIFVIFVLVDGLLMIQLASTDPLYGYVLTALLVFLVLFVMLSFGLLYQGYSNAKYVKDTLK
jgi:hypothetical protein